jgi:RHS repeat-associated protein
MKSFLLLFLSATLWGAGSPQEAPPQEAPPQEAPPQEAPPQEAPPQEAPPQEALPQAHTTKKIVDRQENFFQTSTTYSLAPHVNPITGDLIEEETDLIVAGCQPLSVRRSYCQSTPYNPRYGGWDYNPETFLVANFEYGNQEGHFAAVGSFDGSITPLKSSSYHTYTFKPSKSFIHPNGQTHPLNTILTYSKKVDPKNKHRFQWVGEVKEGSGTKHHFYSPMHTWLDLAPVEVNKVSPVDVEIVYTTPDAWTPYQLRIQETHLPNGNILCYTWIRWKDDKKYPRPALLNTITAYNKDRTKTLGSITFTYHKDKHEDVKAIAAHGSDGRVAGFGHQGKESYRLTTVDAPGKSPLLYGYQKNGTLVNIHKPENRLLSTTYDASQRVISQSAPVGPNGEIHPIARYNYLPNATEVFDAENNKTTYYYNTDKQIYAITYYQGTQPYRTDRFSWDSAGNLIRKTSEDATGQILQITEYTHDKNQNPILERIGDGTTWRTTKRTYSEDGFNLKLTETPPSGLTTHYHYLPNTNLLTAELIYAEDKLCKRTFYTYDDCAIVTRTITDDGSTLDPSNLTNVTYRKITTITPRYENPCFGLSQTIQEKTIDTQGQEILLSKITYTYHPSGKVATEAHYDAQNQYLYTIYNTYDHQEHLISTTDPLGHTTHLTYDPNLNLTHIKGPKPNQLKTITYDLANRPIRITDQQPNETLTIEKKYNKLGQLITEIDACGHPTHFEYDCLGRQITLHHPDGARHTKTYDILSNLIQETDPEGYTTQTTYDCFGNPLTIHHPDGTQEQFTYTPTGAVATHTDPLGAQTQYQYDPFDHPISITVYSPTGQHLKTTTATYTPFYQLTQTDPEGITTTYTYDFAGRKTAAYQDTQIISYSYDSQGRVNKTDHQNYQIHEEYDDLNHPIAKKIFGPTPQYQEEYLYDETSHLTHRITSHGPYITHYNTFGKPISEQNPLGQLTTHTHQFTKTYTHITTDPLGLQTLEIHDSRGRIAEIIQKKADKILTHQLKTYDKNNHLIQQTHHNGPQSITHHWTYGPKGRLEKFVEADQKETHYTYNPQGCLATIVKPSGITLHHEWDSLGRLIRYTSTDFDYTYTYDRCDRLLSVYDKISRTKTTRIYNPLGKITQETLANGLSLLNTYDPQSRRLELTLPDRTTMSYTYQGAYLYSVKRNNQTHTYITRDLDGQILQATLPYQLGQITIQRDPLSRWEKYQSPTYTAHFPKGAYDPAGNLLHYEYIDTLSKETCTYTYDDLYQLIAEKEHTYTFDTLYNRLTKDNRPHQINPLCQILNDGRTTYQYDPDGNLTFDGQWHYTYDTQNRLITAENKPQRLEFTYDPFHRRLTRKYFLDGRLIHNLRYLWDGDNEIGAVTQEGEIIELRILGEGLGAEIGAALFYELNNKTYIPIHDHRGSVVSLIDPKTQKAESYRYTAFGEPLTPNRTSPWRFSSKRSDPETGLVYFGRRYYYPSLGRWMTQDPQGFDDGPNLYAYAHNSPLTEIDLYGEWGEWLHRACYWSSKFGRASFDYAFPCASALYRLPTNASLWKRGALAFGAVGETALLFAPPLKVGATLTEKAIFQIGRSALTRHTERQMLRSVSKSTSVATERKIIQDAASKKGMLFDLDTLSKAGQIMDRGGLTRAGRALDKHGGRPGSVFPKATGNPINKNIQGQYQLDDILTHPQARIMQDQGRGFEIYVPDGRGVYFKNGNIFRGFIEDVHN